MKKQWESPKLESLNAQLTNEITCIRVFKHYYLCDTCHSEVMERRNDSVPPYGNSFPCPSLSCIGTQQYRGYYLSEYGNCSS